MLLIPLAIDIMFLAFNDLRSDFGLALVSQLKQLVF
jgi:hypothetical protein